VPTYTVTGRPVVVDDFRSTAVQVQNTGPVNLTIHPLGRQVAPGATVTVPGWAQVPTTLRTAGQLTTAVVTLTQGTPAAQPGPGALTLDSGPVGSMSVTISGGSWFTDEGLTSAAAFPFAVSGTAVLYPAAPASVTVTATGGGTTAGTGMNLVDGCSETFRFTDWAAGSLSGVPTTLDGGTL
jgi:hypothetical protein